MASEIIEISSVKENLKTWKLVQLTMWSLSQWLKSLSEGLLC